MWILSNFDSFIFLVTFALAILPTLKLCYLLFSLIKLIIKTKGNLYRWKNGIINLEDLQHLTQREFEFWCGEFIKKLGYSDIIQSKSGVDGGKNIVCKKFGETSYIECKKYSSSTNALYSVDNQVCKKLIGTMVYDGVTKGIIITSGKIKNNAINYINTLPKEYEIELLEGEDIIRQYSYLHEKRYKVI